MSACHVYLVFLIWCQVLNLSAAENEESAVDNENRGNGTVFTVPSNRPTSHSPGAGWETKIKGATSHGQGTASDYKLAQRNRLKKLKDYRFVFPYALSGNQKWSVSVLQQWSQPDNISISVELDRVEVILDLKKNTYLTTKDFQISYHLSNETVVTEKGTDLYQCYYQGSVRRYPGSQVSASTCSGLSALIIFNNRTYIIEPLEGDESGRHVAYRTEEFSRVSTNCGVKYSVQELTITDRFLPQPRVQKVVLREVKYLETVFVADKQLFEKHGSRDATVRHLLSVVNTLDMYHRPLKLRVIPVTIEVWEADQFAVDSNAAVTLTRFLNWKINRLNRRVKNDNAQLLV
ncbi:disintegrin and metalloproteinase domain-containing protein 8-like [Chiloscyllium punctatum]|uniref:disintegrin and metalloproteinase domain-containing protein 8-like n=1 Tax=Chiloscyllium punctatum TaxID=137246 RepID=UPI003B641EFA